MQSKDQYFTYFRSSIEGYSLPERFTNLLDYEPNPLCLLASKELQLYIETQTEWKHNFGVDHRVDGTNIGKMFGVLVVQNELNEIGYLSAFSGKLAGKNDIPHFVPPVVDLLREGGFYRRGEDEISAINQRIKELETSSNYLDCLRKYENNSLLASEELSLYRKDMKEAKLLRDTLRERMQQELDAGQFDDFKERLKNESLKWQYDYKQLVKLWNERLDERKRDLDVFTDEIASLKEQRKSKSADLQQRMFDQYQFLNILGEQKGVYDIFQQTDQKIPPAGAGDCAGPKLLQYAFMNKMKPLAMAEFWWGQSPSSEIRKHGHFYPSCRGKCEPILGHMLKGMDVDGKPVTLLLDTEFHVDIIYEDEAILVVNKPPEFLSVPGKTDAESMYSIIKSMYPDATGPLLVHRLDMSTSGLLLIAKTKESHKILQAQFLEREVKKRYVALLDGIISVDEGTIDLPLRVDLDNRPHQLVCYEYGKPAITSWKVLDRANGKTRVHFFPVTGRTHQLRVHAAHQQGLNCPIVGDDLYGKKADRLYLHAEFIQFTHPVSKELMMLKVEAGF